MEYRILINTFLILFSLVGSDEITADNDKNVEIQQSEYTHSESPLTDSLPIFGETTITRSHLNSQGLKWKNTMGDWEDLNGKPQGEVPWATAIVNRKTRGPITLDVTTIAKEQQHKKNQLMILSATIPVKVSSREGIQSPILKIILQDGKLLKLLPELDASIDASTYRNINTKILSMSSNDSKSFIQFKLPNEKIQSANLELSPLKIYGSGQIKVFNLAPQNAPSAVKQGIANGLTSYASLKGHPDVIFIDTFEGTTIKPEWFWQKKVRGDQVNNGYLTGNIDPIRKNRSAFNIRYFFAKHVKEEPTEISFRYSIRFHKNFVYATQGGKLPGQSGTYNTCGWGGRRPSNKCRGWSARMHFKQPIETGPYRDMIPIGTYLYHLDQTDYYGDQEKWQAFCKLDQWCELEQYVKLNTPGNNDGILRGYHNGMLVYERTNIRYRNHENVKIEDIWTLVYHGGTGLPTKTISADIDNVVISRAYIGSLKKSSGK